MDCELCGKQLGGVRFRVSIEGVELVVCRDCYRRVTSGKVDRVELELAKAAKSPLKQPTPKPRTSRKSARMLLEDLELVEDYNIRIREAREALGWSWSILAQKVGENENVIKRVESGKLIPTIELARKLEKILKVKLLQPTVDEVVYKTGDLSRDVDLTLGDVAFIRRRKLGKS